MFRLIYYSASKGLFDADELLDILRVSRRNNTRDGVTGLLLYHDGSIMQVLEGPGDAVEKTFARIAADPRHTELIVLMRKPITERYFGAWAMGLGRRSTLEKHQGFTAADRAAFSDVMNRPRTSVSAHDLPLVERLVHRFRDVLVP